jgi:hypothetical protein
MRLLFVRMLIWWLSALTALRAEPSVAAHDRVGEAQREVVLAESSLRSATARLEDLQRSPEATTDQILAAETVVYELTELVKVRRETLRDLEAMARETESSPDPGVTEGMEAFESAVDEVDQAEDPETEQERLEREFAASLEKFDGMILEHHRKVEDRMAVRSARGEAEAAGHRSAAEEAEALLRSMGVESGGAGEGGAAETAGQPNGSESSGDTEEASTAEGTEVAGGGSAGGGAGGSGASRPPREDEDVVARQLREAAEKETDPVLREKLWKEYEAYVEGRS